jgi:predicted ATPase
MAPQIKRQRTLDAIKRIILSESLQQPVVVIFEDLHWIDAQTQALLDLLADGIANSRGLLLSTTARSIVTSGATNLTIRNYDWMRWTGEERPQCSRRC